jgi:uncharacterized SAM-binding protein YcdF (DUF218 family)
VHLVATLFLPPLGPLLLAAAGALLCARHRRLGATLLALGLGAQLLLATPLVAALLLGSLQWHAPLAPDARPAGPQVVVVLGASLEPYAPEYAAGAAPGALSLERLRYGAVLSSRLSLPVLVCGGPLEPGAPPLADLLAACLRTELRPGAEVWTEDQSRTTWENAERAGALLSARGLHHVLLVTHGFHMPRSVYAFERAGLTVTAAPTGLRQRPGPRARDFRPSARALQQSALALHEWLGLAWYRVRAASDPG